MADKNIQKALYGPSTLEVALGAILGILVGIVAAFFYFVFKPIEKVDKLPKEPVANVVYFIPGRESAARSKGWQAKQKTFLAGGEILVDEEELNAWGATLSDFKPAEPKKPTVPPAKPGTPPKPGAPGKPLEPEATEKDVVFAVGAPNFSIKDNRLQIAMVCHLSYYGVGADVWVQANGRFSKSGDGFKFVPAELYFGSCPLHLIPTAPSLLVGQLLPELKITDEMQLAWSKVSMILVEGDRLKIVTKP